MAIDKIQSESINLADNFAFTGTVSGAGGITEADMFRLTADIAQGTNAVISSNLERVDDSSFSKIGTGMSESSGVFTFGATGLYHLIANPLISSYNDNNSYISAELSTDSGSNFNETLFVTNNGIDGTPRMNSSVYQSTFLNVTNATTFRVRFRTSTFGSNTYVYGNTNENYTTFTFIRLGDSQ
nr:filamentous hemagglutinin-like protein [uncultured Mediterranean phage uvMED]